MPNYKEVLKSAGYPTDVLVLDFETYFDQDYTLSKMSTIEYICSPKFEFTGCGIQVIDNRNDTPDFYSLTWPKFFRPAKIQEAINDLKQEYGPNLERCTVVAKNCKFDMTILAVKFGIIPPYIIDIDDLLRYYDSRMSHKMKDVAPMFGLQDKGDTNQFKGLHYEDMDKGTKANLRDYGCGDIEIEVALFKILLPKITNSTIELPVARHTLDLYLRPRIAFDFKAAGELKAKMTMELDKIVDTTGCVDKAISGNLSFVKLLQYALPEDEQIPVKAGKPGKNMIKLLGKPGVIPALAKDDTGFQELLVHPNKIVRNLCVARQAVKSWPLHIKRIDNMANQADTSGGLLRVPLHYYGGHTGRWSGGEKINLQNLGGRGRAGQGTHPLIQQMRSLLCALEGYILGIADSAQIEARILAWLAGQDDLVEDFANGIDIYSNFATELFQSTVYKPKEDEFDPIKTLLKIRRGFGKDTILGCGYGMGTNRFFSNCISNKDLRPYFDSGEYDWDFIDQLIKMYRKKYPRIPEFWKTVEKAFKWVIKYPHESVQIWTGGYLRFSNDNGTVHIRLPSGRELLYRHCALKQTTRGSEIRWHWGHLWGGSITENIVQAVARDLLAWWILEMENRNGADYTADPLPVVLHSHDEIICMLHKDEAESGLQSMLQIMKRSPDWAEGLPLDAEGCLSERYKK